jgi:hypothetical protein
MVIGNPRTGEGDNINIEDFKENGWFKGDKIIMSRASTICKYIKQDRGHQTGCGRKTFIIPGKWKFCPYCGGVIEHAG